MRSLTVQSLDALISHTLMLQFIAGTVQVTHPVTHTPYV